jgi:hypothetical protein
MPLENLSHFNQYKIYEPKMPDRLQEKYNVKHQSDCIDSQKTQDKKYNWKQRNTVATSCGSSDNMYSMSHVTSEKSGVQDSEIFTSRTSDTYDVLEHPVNNGPNGMRDCSIKCDAGLQEKMTPSLLSQALM